MWFFLALPADTFDPIVINLDHHSARATLDDPPPLGDGAPLLHLIPNLE